MKQSQLEFYYDVLFAAANRSYCQRLKVGALIVDEDEDNIIAYGYNGTPPGEDNVCEGIDGKTLPHTQHAEPNAIRKTARSHASSKGKTMLCTHSPCKDCAIDIHMAGITKLIYVNGYRSDEGIEYLKRKGIIIHKINVEDDNTQGETND